MKILHLSAAKEIWGGAENHIENLCIELEKMSSENKNIILCVKNSEFHHRLKDSKISFATAPLTIKADPRYIYKIIKICRREKIDLIHIHDPTALTLAVMADIFSTLPPFILSKKTSFPIKNRKQTLFKYNYTKIKRILCVSEEARRMVLQRIDDHNKILTIYHGTNLETKSDITPFLLRTKLAIAPDQKIVGTIGNHTRPKNLETWVEIINILINKEKRKDLFFVQMGYFTDRTPELIKKIEELQLQEYISILGFVPNASNFLPQFDLLLVTSEIEGIPQVIYEAFYHRIPVVSTDVGGIPEIITNGSNGLLSPRWDAESLAKNVQIVMDNFSLRQEFTTRGHQRLLDSFSTTTMAKKTYEQYKLVMEELIEKVNS